MRPLINPERVTVEFVNGTKKDFFLSKIPAVEGREIALQYPTSAMPKIGEYQANEALLLKLLSYVRVCNEDGSEGVALNTRDAINNHLPEWEDLVKLEGLQLAYNFSFFRDGKGSTFFGAFIQKFQQSGAQMLTNLFQSLSEKK